MDTNYIKKALRPLQRKVHFEKSVKLLLYVLAAAGIIMLVLSSLSMFTVIPYVRQKMLIILAIAIPAALLAALFLSPSAKKVMIIADSLGLKERVITAWYLKDDSSPVALLQRQDTEDKLRKVNLRAAYKLMIPKKLYITALSLILVAFIVSFIPGKVLEKTRLRETLITEMQKQEDILEEELEKQQEKHPGMTEEQLEELKKALEKLKEEFDKAKTEEDALKALAQMENLLDKLKDQNPLQDLKALENTLADSPLTENLSEAMENKDEQALKEALEELMKEIENQEDRDEMAELLKQAAQSMGNNSMMADALGKIASSATGANANPGELAENLMELIEQATENAEGEQAFVQAAEELGEAAKKAKLAVSSVDRYIAQGSGGTKSNGQGQGEGSEGQSEGSGEQGEGSGEQGKGGQSGGQSQDGGSGAGSGTTNEDAGYKEGDEPGGGRAPGERKESEFQSIYVPERLGGEGNESVISGQKLQSGSSTFNEADGAPVQKGAMLPWREVLSEYREEAVQSMDRQEIPPGMEILVRDYFSSLE